MGAPTLRDSVGRTFDRYRRTFAGFTAGQKLVTVIGTAALLLGGFLVFKWASAPSYAPLYSDLSASDAAAVVDELESSGVPYQLSDGGTMIMVPRDEVYQVRIDLSGQGLPEGGGSGYSILDDQGLATSDFQEQTDYKRAMEGELEATIGAIDGIDAAVVHLAVPEKQVFADEQEPTTASVLVDSAPGMEPDAEQVRAIVHLVASSVEGLDPVDVTVADSAGTVLTAPDGNGGVDTGSSDQQAAVETELHDRLQRMLDRVVGVGNSTVQVTAVLDQDSTVTESTTYQVNKKNGASSTTSSSETYQGPAGSGFSGGVVGPDGQMDPSATGTGGASKYRKEQATSDNPVDVVHERRESPPGTVTSLHVGVALDAATTGNFPAAQVKKLVADTIGIDAARGDTVRVLQVAFDRAAEESAAADLATAKQAEAGQAKRELIRTGAMGGFVAVMVLVAMWRSRSRRKRREQATTYVVEQIRQESAARAALERVEPLALETSGQADESEDERLRQELDALIERQPDDVAALLRGWLTERA